MQKPIIILSAKYYIFLFTFGSSKIFKFNHAIAKLPSLKEPYVRKMSRERVLLIANDWLNGLVNIGYDAFKPIKIDEFKDFWNIKYEHSSANTFYLYFYGLRGLYYMARAYDLTGDVRYVAPCLDLVSSFYNSVYDKNITNPFLENDHALAERIENLSYVYAIFHGHSSLNDSVFAFLIGDAVNLLLGESKYQKNHNHGIIADHACLIGLHFLNADDTKHCIEYVIKRLSSQIAWAYGEDGVHCENSFDYHVTITDLLYGCRDSLQFIGINNELINKTIESAIRFCIYAIKPTGWRPLFGDSKGVFSSTSPPRITEWYSEELDYINSYGKQGVKPNEHMAYFSSGYVFLREHFNEKDFTKATQISVRCGYKSRVHKHCDDMSLTIQSGGVDLFIDPGMFTYEYAHPLRQYMESVQAHTTIGIKNKDYSIARFNGQKFKILKKSSSKQSFYVLCFSRVYTGVLIYRHLFYLPSKDTIIVLDEIFSQERNTYYQNWHLSENISIQDLSYNRTVLTDPQENLYCYISQLELTEFFTANKLISVRPSKCSRGFGVVSPTSTLAYEKSAKDTKFLTAIQINKYGDDEFNIEYHDGTIKINDGSSVFSLDIPFVDELLYLTPSINITSPGIGVIEANGIYEHTCYLFDKSNNIPQKKHWHNSDQEIYLSLLENKDYVLIYYMRGVQEETIFGIAAEIIADKDTHIVKRYQSLIQPEIQDFNVSFIDGFLSAIVHTDYVYKSRYKWFLYKNSHSLYVVEKDDPTFSFKISEPGEYVIIISVSDVYFGEYYFKTSKKYVINEVNGNFEVVSD